MFKIKEILISYLSPKKNVMVERHKFLSCIQTDLQSIPEYVSTLRKCLSTCDFKCNCNLSIADIFLSSQFIRGIRDTRIREALLINNELEFQKLYDRAIALEAAKIDRIDMGLSKTYASSEGINKISKRNLTRPSSSCSDKQNGVFLRKPSNTSSVNLKDIGLDGLCLRCGRNNHTYKTCRIDRNKLHCQSCNKTGHIKKVCITTLSKQHKSIKGLENHSSSCSDISEDFTFSKTQELNEIIDIFNENTNVDQRTEKYFIDIIVEGKSQRFEVDSGAGLTLIPKNDFDHLKLNCKIKPTSVRFRSYTSGVFEPLGVAKVNVKYNNIESKEMLFIVPNQFSPILGRSWIRKFKIDLMSLDESCEQHRDIHLIDQNTVKKAIIHIDKEYEDIFKQEVGCIPKFVSSLRLRENSKPVFIKPREIPYALREKVETELDSLEKDGIIEKVDHSDWGSPLVVIPKPDGNVRLCVDYKTGVNSQLLPSHYPVPSVDETINELRDAEYFCTIDLYKAYLHVKVDQDTSVIQTISTHRGTYRVNRLNFGIHNAPSEFHRIRDQVLVGLEGVAGYFDDLTIYGRTFTECYTRLKQVLNRLREYNIHVNRNKCQFFQKEINFLGYVIKKNCILKCPKRIEAIQQLKRPADQQSYDDFLEW